MKTNVTAKIKDLKFGVKEDVITLTIDGNIKDEQVSILRQIKKTGVAFISFSNSQLDFDDVKASEPKQGIPYTLVDGAVQVEKEEGEQAELIVDGDEIKTPLDSTNDTAEPKDDGKVTNISAKAQAKLDKAKQLDPMAALLEETKVLQDDELPM